MGFKGFKVRALSCSFLLVYVTAKPRFYGDYSILSQNNENDVIF